MSSDKGTSLLPPPPLPCACLSRTVCGQVAACGAGPGWDWRGPVGRQHQLPRKIPLNLSHLQTSPGLCGFAGLGQSTGGCPGPAKPGLGRSGAPGSRAQPPALSSQLPARALGQWPASLPADLTDHSVEARQEAALLAGSLGGGPPAPLSHMVLLLSRLTGDRVATI